jgi:hypothetical protein
VKKGAPWLKPLLVQYAYAAARAKNSYLQAQFLRLKARRGPKKAAIAVAASILTAVYHMLRDGTFYTDLGPDRFARHDKTRAAMRSCAASRTLDIMSKLKPPTDRQIRIRACRVSG